MSAPANWLDPRRKEGVLPQTCTTCRHCKAVERDSPAIMVGAVRHYCREFASMDRQNGNASLLECAYAYDTFCGGANYRPNFWAQMLRALRRFYKRADAA